MTIAYLNGKFLPRTQAVISVMDRGFLFGDGVYEVIPVYHGQPFRAQQHIERLYQSLTAIKLTIPLVATDWHAILQQLITDNKALGSEQTIYLQVTRGCAPERNHAFPQPTQPTLFAYSYPLKTLSYEQLCQGMAVITLPDCRWTRCNIKATALLANVLMYQEALDSGAVEALLIRSGQVLEGTTSNVFIVKEGTLITPPLSDLLLGGITRDLVLEIARNYHIPCQETVITEQQLLDADEVWITSSTREIYPIVKVNENLINHGQVGAVWYKMIKHYRDFIKNIKS